MALTHVPSMIAALATCLLVAAGCLIGSSDASSSSSSLWPPKVNCTGKVLIAMSSVGYLPLHNGTHDFNVTVGFYLDELAIPLQAMLDQGWTATFANPHGNQPPMDPRSDKPFYFAPLNPKLAQTRYTAAKAMLADQATLKAPVRFVELTNKVLDEQNFDAIYIPGGHPPMVDLYKDPELGRILVHFLDAGKPITALCHGPVALLSAGLVRQPWPFAGRHLTVFSNAGEAVNEARWGGQLAFLPADAMAAGGGIMEERAPPPYQPHVVRDLGDSMSSASSSIVVTGQNPFSAPDVGTFAVDSLLSRCGMDPAIVEAVMEAGGM